MSKPLRQAGPALSDECRVPLESVITTAELDRRPSRRPDYEAESHALAALMDAMADASGSAGADRVLQKLVETALDLCRAHSAGVSILEKEDGREVFRWRAAAGVWAKFLGGSMPRELSPCGTVLERNCHLLMSHPERHYLYSGDAPPLVEVLLIPFYREGKPVGTVWIIAHDQTRLFDAEDHRLMTRLSRFAATAYQLLVAQELRMELAAQRALDERLAADLDQLRRTEAALRDSEERFRGIFSQALAGIAQTDLTGRFVQVNERYCEIVGRPAEDLYRLRMQDITHPDDLPRNLPLFEKAVRDGTPFVIEQRYVRPDGLEVWVSNSVSLIRDQRGGPKYIVAVSLDMTARKHAETAHQESHAELTRFNRVAVGRELRMIELKKEVNELCKRLGQPPRYPLEFE